MASTNGVVPGGQTPQSPPGGQTPPDPDAHDLRKQKPSCKGACGVAVEATSIIAGGLCGGLAGVGASAFGGPFVGGFAGGVAAPACYTAVKAGLLDGTEQELF